MDVEHDSLFILVHRLDKWLSTLKGHLSWLVLFVDVHINIVLGVLCIFLHIRLSNKQLGDGYPGDDLGSLDRLGGLVADLELRVLFDRDEVMLGHVGCLPDVEE